MMKNASWRLTTNRFVAFLDIAGTKDRVAKFAAPKIYQKLLKVVTVSEFLKDTHQDIKERVYYSVFSDSLIFISKDDSKESLKTFLDLIAFAFAVSIKQCLPMKGTIAFGEMTVDRNNKIFFGQPLIDAFLIQEKILDYYGVICDNKFKQQANSMGMSLDSWFFEYISFYKKDIRTEIEEYQDKLSWHLDWFRVLRGTNGYDINVVDYVALSKVDNTIEAYIKKLYVGSKEKIIQSLNNTLAVFTYNKQMASDFMKKIEFTNNENKEEDLDIYE